MSKAGRLREALSGVAPGGLTGEQVQDKTGLRGPTLAQVMSPFLERGEVRVEQDKEGNDRFHLNTDYQRGRKAKKKKGGGKPKKPRAARKVKVVKRVPRKPRQPKSEIAALAERVAAAPNGNGLALRHVRTTLTALKGSFEARVDPKLFFALLVAHEEAVELAQQHG